MALAELLHVGFRDLFRGEVMDKLELAPEDMLLDLQNPRLVHVESQAEALRAIIDLDHRHFKTMMESIRDHGLDPGDAFYVIEEEGFEDYIVVDGNRRLAALKVLRQPDLLSGIEIDEKLRVKLAKVPVGYDRNRVNKIDCAVFDSRAAANEWILRRHGRGLEGEARIPWGPLEIQRFQGDRLILDIIDFVEKNSTYSNEHWDEIRAQVSEKSSVLRRLVESNEFRELLGLSVENRNNERIPVFLVSPEATLKVLGRVFSDITKGVINTRNLNNAEGIRNYIDEIPVDATELTKGMKAVEFRTAVVSGPGERPRRAQASGAQKARRTTSTVKPPRPHLAPKRTPFAQPKDAKGQQLIFEASRLQLAITPLACAFVLRATIEHAFDTYGEAEGLSRKNPDGRDLTLSQRASQVMGDLIAKKRAEKNDLRGAERILTNSKDPASIQALNDYNHNRYHIPTGDTLRSAWDACDALFVAIFGKA